ncbi:hypothetical protein [Pseudomonas syringae]|uniref:hypothetical protein n=1 Tax=Pseudomonas syringae TaxID=317 RepID=UPI003AF3ED69
MNTTTKKSALKALVVTAVAVISLQGMAYAAASKPSAPVAKGKYGIVQDAGKTISKDSKSAPMQVAIRIPNHTNFNDPCRSDPTSCG